MAPDVKQMRLSPEHITGRVLEGTQRGGGCKNSPSDPKSQISGCSKKLEGKDPEALRKCDHSLELPARVMLLNTALGDHGFDEPAEH